MRSLWCLFRSSDLAWTDAPDDQRLFRRVTGTVLVVTTGLCLSLLLSPVRKAETAASQPCPRPWPSCCWSTPAARQRSPAGPLRCPEPQTGAQPEAVPQPKPASRSPRRPRRHPMRRAWWWCRQGTRGPKANQVAVVEAARKRVAGMGLLAASDDIARCVAVRPACRSRPTSVRVAGRCGRRRCGWALRWFGLGSLHDHLECIGWRW